MLGKFIRRCGNVSPVSGIERQVEEELHFHHEMLTEHFRECGLSEAEAKRATARRFGDVERVRAECVQISRRNRPVMKFLKLLLLLSAITGLWLRTRGWPVQFVQMGDMLIATGVLGHLLLYLKGMSRRGMRAVKSSPPFSLLGRGRSVPVEAYDELGRTPVERLVADKKDS
jgi:hypothetical protein